MPFIIPSLHWNTIVLKCCYQLLHWVVATNCCHMLHHFLLPLFLLSRSYFWLAKLASCTQWTCDSSHHTYSVYKKGWSYLVYQQMKFWLRHCWRCGLMQQAVHSWIFKVATQACWYCQSFCQYFGIAMSSLQTGFEDS